MVKEVISFLPASIIEATIFIHEDTEMKLHGLYGDKESHSSAQAIRKGIPQGSLASILVAGKVLERHLDKLAARYAVSYVDNVLIGGKTQAEVQANVIALATSFEGHPSGSLRLTGDIKRLGDETMDYLGYRFRRRSMKHGGFGRATFPAATLRLLDAIIADDRSQMPYELGNVLAAIVEAELGLKQSKPWRRLNELGG